MGPGGGVDPPSLIFVLNEEAHFYFPRPQSSMNGLISTVSSIYTKNDTAIPVLYQCSAAHLTNLAEVLAYFVLETDHVSRAPAETLLGTQLDYMTNKEFQETLATSHPQFKYTKQGTFYRSHPTNSARLKGWQYLSGDTNSIVKISKILSFDTFEENVSLLFNRS